MQTYNLGQRILERVKIEKIITGKPDWIDADVAEGLAQPPLSCIKKEFPHFAFSVSSPEGPERPRKKHPIFYGCFDWHSSVHSHWNLVRQMRLIDEHPCRDQIISILKSHFTREKARGEREYFQENENFERPYGWGWFLALIAELYLWQHDLSQEFLENLKPLTNIIVQLVDDKFFEQKFPHRVGTHGNTAFTLKRIYDYSQVMEKKSLSKKVKDKAEEFYGEDKEAPVEYEPLGWDFLSPSLVEANLMRVLLPRQEFLDWFDDFWSNVGEECGLTEPVIIGGDYMMEYHLVGLNLSRAWTLYWLGSSLPSGHKLSDKFIESAKRHARQGIKHAFDEDYSASHWLGSYALYLFTSDEKGIC